ncbi:MAG: hypothetical protein M2R45_00812 [Verrucomicrobia subdivision 3 bacterium]|nr:hypothetical protein [Limisphaerales bacterium]MCS1413082.1 hypothetical protein [Limisphaerales bacterium]
MNTQHKPLRTQRPRHDVVSAEKSKALAAWRGTETTDDAENLRHYHPKTATDLARTLIKTLRLEQRQSETEIVRVWSESIDPVITAHAQPTGIRNGTLFVTVDNNTWLHEIVRYRRKEILDRLQNSFGSKTIQRISFRIG